MNAAAEVFRCMFFSGAKFADLGQGWSVFGFEDTPSVSI